MPANPRSADNRSSQRTAFCFTLNNPTLAQIQDIKNCAELGDDVKRLIFQQEIGEEGTPHLQGFIQLVHPKRFVWIKNKWPCFAGAHFEKQKGSFQQNWDYCFKEATRDTEANIRYAFPAVGWSSL